MNFPALLLRWRSWFPVPVDGLTVAPGRWLLLEANRHAVVGALLSFTFVSILALGRVWTVEMQLLFTETDSVQTILNTLLGGIILLVSVVVSINSIVLTHDITALHTQKDRVQGTTAFRRDIGHVMDTELSPTDPQTFLVSMLQVIRRRSAALENLSADVDESLAHDVEEYAESLVEYVDGREALIDRAGETNFGVLWLALEVDFARHVDRLQAFGVTHRHHMSAEDEAKFDELMEAFELFDMGRAYFKTLYYSREISALSQTLLTVSLPAIIVTAWTILAIDAGTLPDIRLFGLPPLQVFLALTFTVSLAPYLTLTSYVLRTATVARRTASGGPFVLD